MILFFVCFFKLNFTNFTQTSFLAVFVFRHLCCTVHILWLQEIVLVPCGRRDLHLLAFFLINQIKIRKKQKPDFYLRKEMMTGSVTSYKLCSVLCVIAVTFVWPLVLSKSTGRLFFIFQRAPSAVGRLLTLTCTREPHVFFLRRII